MVVPSRNVFGNRTARKGFQRVRKEKRNDKGIQPLGRLSRIAGRALIVPPPVLMVFSVCNYVRAARISLLDWDRDGGRITRRSLNVPGDPVAGYSGLA